MAMESLTCIQCMQHHRQVARNTSLPGTSLKVNRLKTTDHNSHMTTQNPWVMHSADSKAVNTTPSAAVPCSLWRSQWARLGDWLRKLEASKRCPPSTKLSGHKMFSHLHWTFLLQIKIGVCSFSFFKMQCVIMRLMCDIYVYLSKCLISWTRY